MQESLNQTIDESVLNLYYQIYGPFNSQNDDYSFKDNFDSELFNYLLYYNNDEKSTGENGNIKNDDEKKKKKKLGRKTKGEKSNENEHNKFTFDNMLRKSKRIIINELFHYINKKISGLYKDKIGHRSYKKLLLLKYEQIQNTNIDFNKEFLNKTLKEILSAEPSKRVNNCKEKAHNEILIKQLISEGTQEKKDYFNGFFNLTFLDCLKYFRGDENEKNDKYLEGLKRFDDLAKDDKFTKKNEEEYIKELRNFINDFEIILNDKKGRKSYKKRK